MTTTPILTNYPARADAITAYIDWLIAAERKLTDRPLPFCPPPVDVMLSKRKVFKNL